MIDSKENILIADELCLKYDGYWKTWNRVLFLEKKSALAIEVALTPINPWRVDNWMEQVAPVMVRCHRTAMDRVGDRLYRHVVRNKHSLVYREVKEVMLRRIPVEVFTKLMFDNLLGEIDWQRYVEAKNSPTYRGGGIPFVRCQRLHQEA